MTKARSLVRRRAPRREVLPALEEENRRTGLTGAWSRMLDALRGGRDVRSKEQEGS